MWLKIRNLKKLGKGGGHCSGLIPQCWMKMGEGKEKKKKTALGQLRWCKLSNSTNKTAKRFLKAFKLPCELWLPVALEGKLITKQTNKFHMGSDLHCYILPAPSDKDNLSVHFIPGTTCVKYNSIINKLFSPCSEDTQRTTVSTFSLLHPVFLLK